jgi:hypothetical protein
MMSMDGTGNGYRVRNWHTLAGTVELRIPKVRRGSYFPGLLEPRRMAENPLTAVIQESLRAWNLDPLGGTNWSRRWAWRGSARARYRVSVWVAGGATFLAAAADRVATAQDLPEQAEPQIHPRADAGHPCDRWTGCLSDGFLVWRVVRWIWRSRWI